LIGERAVPTVSAIGRAPSGASPANELERLLVPISTEVSSYWGEPQGLRFKNVRRAQQRWAIVSVISVCAPSSLPRRVGDVRPLLYVTGALSAKLGRRA
jgi:hypothetical protein